MNEWLNAKIYLAHCSSKPDDSTSLVHEPSLPRDEDVRIERWQNKRGLEDFCCQAMWVARGRKTCAAGLLALVYWGEMQGAPQGAFRQSAVPTY